jgi:hypothetical protein
MEMEASCENPMSSAPVQRTVRIMGHRVLRNRTGGPVDPLPELPQQELSLRVGAIGSQIQ